MESHPLSKFAHFNEILDGYKIVPPQNCKAVAY